MDLITFLSLDVSDPENIPDIMSFVYHELELIKGSYFSIDNIHKLDGIVNKYIELADYYECSDRDDLIKHTRNLVSNIISNHEAVAPIRTKNNIGLFEIVSSRIIGIYSQIIRKQHNVEILSEFNLLYNPNFSDKESASLLIEEAIKLIKEDDQLSDRQKDQIIKLLAKALANLKMSKTNWTFFFGNIHQAILILGALGSLVGGIGSWVAISKANEKIIEATQLIEKTSINQYYSHNIQINYSTNQYNTVTIDQSLIKSDTNMPSLAIPEKTAGDNEGEE